MTFVMPYLNIEAAANRIKTSKPFVQRDVVFTPLIEHRPDGGSQNGDDQQPECLHSKKMVSPLLRSNTNGSGDGRMRANR
jgi:hypothetical protein